MIKIENLSKTFGSKKIYEDFNFEFEKGVVYGIQGPSGSGKSTLLNILGQIDLEYEGKVYIDGTYIERSNRKMITKLLKEKIFYLFQNYALVDDKTVDENFNLILKVNPSYKENKKKALEKVGLDDSFLNMPVYALSGGEQQRVSLARTFLRNCEIILADEPTGNLDIENANKVFEVLKEISQDMKVVIIATHDDKLLAKCDKVLRIK